MFSESDTDMVFVLSSEGLIVDLNMAVEITLGYSRALLLGKKLVSLYPESHVEDVTAQVNRMMHAIGNDFYYPMLTMSGDILPVETKIFHATWSGDDALIAICRNLALPKKVYKQRLSGVETFKPELFIYDLKKRRFIAFNHAVLKILDYHPDELLNASINELTFLHLPGQILEISSAVKNGMSIKDYELIVTSKHGLPFSLTLDIDKFSVSGKELLFFVITHITELGAAEEKVRYQLLQQKLLASVSQLLNEPEFYRNLDEVLRLIGEHTGVSRTYIFEDNEAGTETFNTFEWCNEGVEPAIADLQGIPYEIIPSWKRMLIGEGRVFSTDIMTLPADAVAILEPQGIKSILVYPLY
ncbi:MAG: PAS domain S-box protein, partial [Bacteroidetes bacterium]|nr:PAS domain S-box protein [Bacteroidota bacterium]